MQRLAMIAVTTLMLLAALPLQTLAQPGPTETSEDATAKNSYLRFDRAHYRPELGDCVRVAVRDSDQNQNPELAEKVGALVASIYPETASGDREELILQETGPDSSIFETGACLPLSLGDAAEGDETLQVHPGDLIAGMYQDPDNPIVPESTEEIEQEINKLLAGFDASADVAVIAGGQAVGDFSFEIDETLAVEQPAEPLDVIAGPQGFPIVFGAGRIVFQPVDDADLGSFGQQYGAQVIDQFELPVAGLQAGPNDMPQLRRFAVLHVDVSQVDIDDLAYLAELLGAKGHYRFSTERAAQLFALLIAEQLGGRLMNHDPVMWQLVAPRTDEHPVSPGSLLFRNGFNQAWFNSADVRVREAIAHLDLIDRNMARSVEMAFIDGGFARPEDYPEGDPLHDMVNPDFGLSSVSGGPNPAAQCAGGDGDACDWHGTGSLSIAAAVADNQFGAIGVAGHARLPDGTAGVQGLVEPVLMTAFSPFYSSVARQIDNAIDLDVDLINISGGFPCEPFLGIDFCKWETRAAAYAVCTFLFFDPGIFGPFGALLSALAAGIGCDALHTFISEVDFSAHDALRTVVNRARLADIPITAAGPEVVTFLGANWGPFVAGDIEFLPCILDGVICVGAMDADATGDRQPMAINPFGSEVDIWAPGDGLEVTPTPASGGDTTTFTGTSASSPFIGGVIAMMLAANPALTSAEILTILQETSNLFDNEPTGDCEAHPVSTANCVGYVDALAAVERAAGVSLVCTAWDPGTDDSPGLAVDLGMPFVPAFGDTTTVSTGADRVIHALPGDSDFYRFRVPVLPGAPDGDTVSTRLTLSIPQPELGDGLVMQLLVDSDPGAGITTLDPVAGPGTLLAAELRNDHDYYFRVFAPDQPHLRDNCYEVTVEVLNPPAPDRYEFNDVHHDASPATEEWTHKHLVCPPVILWDNPEADCSDVLDDGFASHGAQEIWTMTIPGLSLHTTGDADFLYVELPDPAAHDDEIVECGFTTRTDEFGETIGVSMPGSLVIEAVPTGNAVSARPAGPDGETLGAYRTSGALIHADPTSPFRVQIDCPRTREDLRELIVSFGERVAARDPFGMGGYELRLTYLIEIQRGLSARAYDLIAGREARLGGAAPCFDPGFSFGPGSIPSDVFPYCPPDLEGWGRVELPRPDGSKGGDPCWNDGPCPDIFVFRVSELLKGLDVRVRATQGIQLRLVNGDLDTLAESMPLTNDPKAGNQQGPWIESELKFPTLKEGLYYLMVEGPAGMVELAFVPPLFEDQPQ